MLPESERLRKDALFQRTYAAKRTISTPIASLYAIRRFPNSSPRLPLVGFVVGKKVHLKATSRNLIKRRLREAYRLLRQEMSELDQWYTLVWVAREKINTASWKEIQKNLREMIISINSKYGHN